MPRIAPLPLGASSELNEVFDVYRRALGFVPNSVLIMQRRPKMAKALAALAASVWDPASTVSVAFKRVIAHVASRATGCRYCMAHTAGAAVRLGLDAAKLDAVWEYQSSPLYTPAERVALDYTLAASAVPNEVDDALFKRMQAHWSDDDIVEITGFIAMFGFMNRWNDTMATPLEAEPAEFGATHLARHGWEIGKQDPHIMQNWPTSPFPWFFTEFRGEKFPEAGDEVASRPAGKRAAQNFNKGNSWLAQLLHHRAVVAEQIRGVAQDVQVMPPMVFFILLLPALSGRSRHRLVACAKARTWPARRMRRARAAAGNRDSP